MVPVEITDESGAITSLSTATSVVFDVKDDAGAAKYTDQAATVSGMIIDCLIDTNSGGLWAKGHYTLTVKFTIGPERPVLPVDIYVY